MDFNVGLCKPSQTEVLTSLSGPRWKTGVSLLSACDEWPVSLLCTEALSLLHPARSCSQDMGDVFSDFSPFQILLMHPF